MKFILCFLIALTAANGVMARSYSIRALGSSGKSGDNDYLWMQDKSKRVIVELSVGRPWPKDKLDPIEIRAASVFKDIRTRKAFINDIARANFAYTNSATHKVIIVSGSAGKRVDRDAKVSGGYDFSHGNAIAGIIIEIWQQGKCLKHLTNIPGAFGKFSLGDGALEMLLNEDDIYESDRILRTPEEIEEYKESAFKNHTVIKVE